MGLKQVYFVTVSFLESVHLVSVNPFRKRREESVNPGRGGGEGAGRGGGVRKNNKNNKERNNRVTPHL